MNTDNVTLPSTTDQSAPAARPRVRADATTEFSVEPFFREGLAPDYVVVAIVWQLTAPKAFEQYDFEDLLAESSAVLDGAGPLYGAIEEACSRSSLKAREEVKRNTFVRAVKSKVGGQDRKYAHWSGVLLRSDLDALRSNTKILIANDAPANRIAFFELGNDLPELHAAISLDWDDRSEVPQLDESAHCWAARTAVDSVRLRTFLRRLDICGGDLNVCASLNIPNAKDSKIEFLVPGLIAKGGISLLVGEKKAGKSTLLTELAVVVGKGGGTWCGFDVPASACDGLAVLFRGEDPPAVTIESLRRMAWSENDALKVVTTPPDKMLAELKALTKHVRVSLLVIDPVRAYYKGDEDSSDPVSSFFNQIEEFTKNKNCATVAAHHPKRMRAGAHSLTELAENVRGSSVFLDRPRTTLGLLRQKNATVLGIPVVNGSPLQNLPTEMMFAGERRLVRDVETHRHVPVAGTAAVSSAHADPSVLAVVRAAVGELASEGKRVTRTGKSALLEQRPALGLSRRKVAAAIDKLIEDKDLLVVDGALEIPDKSDKPIKNKLMR